MRTEAPEIKRCCFCIPLRRGLISWGYIKVAMNIAAFSYLVIVCTMIWSHLNRTSTKFYVIITLAFASLVADTVFNVLFVVAGHKKSIKLLKISYVYNMVALGLSALGYGVKLCESLYYLYAFTQFMGFHVFLIVDLLLTASFALVGVFIQIYFILAIRSEMVKLQKQSLEMQFSNSLAAGEPGCTLHKADPVQRTEHEQTTEKLV